MEINNLPTALDLLVKYWMDQGITINKSNNLNDIKSFELKKGILLPHDFILYFQRVNGMKPNYPSDFDKEGFLFYSLQQATTLAEEFGLSKSSLPVDPTKCLLIGEYMHKSWWYGVYIDNERKSYSIGIIPEKSKFKTLSNDLTEFISLYLNNSSELYNYE